VTLTLAVGLQRMVKRHALIRRLPSVETLGAVTVICTDKTGTLTRNQMTVREVYAGRVRFHVNGTGHAPRGEFLVKDPAAATDYATTDGGAPDRVDHRQVDPADHSDLVQALTVAALCNQASLQEPVADDDAWTIVGDPTEGALLVVAAKAGVDAAGRGTERIQELPFDSDRKAMSVVFRGVGTRPIMYTKGAPEVVLPKCITELVSGEFHRLSDARREEIRAIGAEMAAHALRVLALAYREQDHDAHPDYPEEGLAFAGLVGMIDPPREEAVRAGAGRRPGNRHRSGRRAAGRGRGTRCDVG
jgi:Ca2+-transporting ATPase